MVFEWLGQGLVVLTLVGCVLLGLVIVGMGLLLRQHLALRHEALAAESRRLAYPLPHDSELPHVVVQIPVFNEGALVDRAVANAARLDWPSDKLHVQVCDDSTDETTALAFAATQRVSAAGIDAVVVRRPDRNEFKAGSLKRGMANTDHEYIAIFDVDYVTQPDFLRRCMTVLLAEPKLGFVQARIDFLNADENALTRAQTIILDYHYGFEQATRSWMNHLMPFNGTCGIWRRMAIEDAGGWRGDTLSEDWDLSYRAWMKGWRGTFITLVTAAGELPTGIGAWRLQQRRWAVGGGQVLRRMLPAFVSESAPFWKYWNALIPVATTFAHAMFSALLIAAVAAGLLRPSSALMLGVPVYAVFASVSAVLFASMMVANRTVRRATPVMRFVLDFPLVLILYLYVSWAVLRSLPGALLGHQRIFVRTPKRGSIPSPP